jgi:hypothetical protein
MHPQGRHHCTLRRLADSVLGVLFMVCGIMLVHADDEAASGGVARIRHRLLSH